MRSQLKYQLRPLRLVTLTDAYWLAIDLEQGAPAKKQFQQYSSTSKTTYVFSKHTTALPDKPNEFKAPAITQRAKEPDKCWRCGDTWFHGHKCKQAPAINLLAGEELEENPPEQ